MVRGEFWEEKQRKDQEYTLFDSSIGFIKCCYHMPGSMYYRLHFHLPEQAWVCPAAAKSLQSCDPIDGSPPGSPVPGILQARTLEWVAISFSNAWKWKVKVKSLSRVRLLVTPWTAAHQGPPSMGFSRQEYWSGVPLPSTIYSCYKLLIRYLMSKCVPPFCKFLCTFFEGALWSMTLFLFNTYIIQFA